VMVDWFGTEWAFEYYIEPPEERFWPAGMIDISPGR
jgi:hypothetical protein